MYFAGCIADLAGAPVGTLADAWGVAMTPLVADVYAGGSAVSHFRVDAAGNLYIADRLGDYVGCTPVTPGVFGWARAVAVTSNGSQLYAAAHNGSAISHYTIAGLAGL